MHNIKRYLEGLRGTGYSRLPSGFFSEGLTSSELSSLIYYTKLLRKKLEVFSSSEDFQKYCLENMPKRLLETKRGEALLRLLLSLDLVNLRNTYDYLGSIRSEADQWARWISHKKKILPLYNLPPRDDELLVLLRQLRNDDQSLMELFDWSKSPEGFAFWANAANDHDRNIFMSSLLQVFGGITPSYFRRRLKKAAGLPLNANRRIPTGVRPAGGPIRRPEVRAEPIPNNQWADRIFADIN